MWSPPHSPASCKAPSSVGSRQRSAIPGARQLAGVMIGQRCGSSGLRNRSGSVDPGRQARPTPVATTRAVARWTVAEPVDAAPGLGSQSGKPASGCTPNNCHRIRQRQVKRRAVPGAGMQPQRSAAQSGPERLARLYGPPRPVYGPMAEWRFTILAIPGSHYPSNLHPAIVRRAPSVA